VATSSRDLPSAAAEEDGDDSAQDHHAAADTALVPSCGRPPGARTGRTGRTAAGLGALLLLASPYACNAWGWVGALGPAGITVDRYGRPGDRNGPRSLG